MMLSLQIGKQAALRIGANKPVFEHGPKLRGRSIGEVVGCKATIPFRRLLVFTTWPVLR
jgi:hypothetical protein